MRDPLSIQRSSEGCLTDLALGVVRWVEERASRAANLAIVRATAASIPRATGWLSRIVLVLLLAVVLNLLVLIGPLLLCRYHKWYLGGPQQWVVLLIPVPLLVSHHIHAIDYDSPVKQLAPTLTNLDLAKD